MTKRDLFRVIIKSIGLFSMIAFIMNLVNNFILLLSFQLNVYTNILIVLICILAILFIVYIIYKPDSIINLLKLDKGYDDNRFEISINLFNLVCISIISIALYMLVNNIGFLINNIIFYFKSIDAVYMANNLNYSFISPCIFIILSSLLLFNYRLIANFILKNGNNESTDNHNQTKE